ncbi:MAG: metallophosphoesterase, partial [Actinomycetota bacterium]|nr:metallophosphoesterase [Actinomycetota bacterium]
STLRATLADPDGDGRLEPGPPQPMADRTELAPAARPGRVIATLGQLTDTHVVDEESPVRVPFIDRFGGDARSAFRPQEAMAPHVLAAALRSLERERPQAIVVTGDTIDNAQPNELATARAILDGGRVAPDSGARGYRGVQERANPDPLYYRPDLDPPRHPGLLAAAQRPFRARGARVPWHPVIGNHDVLRQGELAPSPRTDAVAIGRRLVTSLEPEFRLPEEEEIAPAVDALLDAGIPGDDIRVPADAGRAALTNEEVVGRLGRGRPLRAPDRLDYVFDAGARLRGIVLDTASRAGGAGGVVSPEQVVWLREQLVAAGRRDVLVFSHHRLAGAAGGEAAAQALAESSNVLATVAGHSHRNRLEVHRTAAGAYWEIGTSSLIDFPQQARMLRVRETAGGGRVIETWTVDHDGRGLAATARELAFLDAQGGRPLEYRGARKDRNARLYLPAR